ncbi:MAG: phosphoglycolate/pyridoxal phosphate family phosphatase [Capsulimonadaceae bacterium]|nr:phosphoglycolate/pyridoxal phosphate family phosphatase [Capsulimonadaceae bacterium]
MPISTYVFDMDGVLFRGETPIPDAVAAIDQLQRSGRKVYLLTNNSGSSRDDYVAKLARMNMHVPIDNIFTSAYATAIYLRNLGAAGKTVFIIGQSGIALELSAAGLRTVVSPDELPYTQIDYVVAGIDRSFTYDKLRYAHSCISHGHAQFIATNRDATYPVENGTIPGAGSIVASVAVATGIEPLVIGKPEPHALQAILDVSGSSPSETLMIGDRLDTDIAAGKRLNVPTVLVLTGVSTEAEALSAEPALTPDQIIGSLLQLLEA